MNYNMNNMKKTVSELHVMLKTSEKSIDQVLMIWWGGVHKKKHVKGPSGVIKSNAKPKSKGDSKGKIPKDEIFFHCSETGHWKINYPKFLEKANWTYMLAMEQKLSPLP